jgi:site-specific DNA-methyltransferase (cytosine-N4-specific)
MIGNREITDKNRRNYWELYQERKAFLPAPIRSLIERVERLNSQKPVGFRRRNLAALLGKYFFDMKDVLSGIAKLLKRGGHAFVVVGNNRTEAGGEPVNINTARLLAELGEAVGLERLEEIPMEMLVSRDIFRKNAMPSEVILSFRRGG